MILIANDATRLEVPPASPLSAAETHGIALKSGNRLIAHSDGRGWMNIYASLATESPWAGTLQPVSHHCLVYCVHQTATIKRAIDRTGRVETARLCPRQLTIIPAGVVSHWDMNGRPDILLLYLRSTMMDRIVQEGFGADAEKATMIPRLAMIDPLLEQLSLAILEGLRGEQVARPFYIESLAHTIAVRLVSHHMGFAGFQTNDGSATREDVEIRLQRVRNHIDASLSDVLTLDVLADAAGLSTGSLLRAFKTRLGETPHQYVVRQRIERAKQLLRSTRIPIAELALMTGFSSQSHLSMLFQRSVGVGPARYRRNMGN